MSTLTASNDSMPESTPAAGESRSTDPQDELNTELSDAALSEVAGGVLLNDSSVDNALNLPDSAAVGPPLTEEQQEQIDNPPDRRWPEPQPGSGTLV